jgi:GNAT superfamily N-acetyltransferase
MPGLDIVRYDQGFREAVLDLLRCHWGSRREVNEAQLDWKHAGSPDAGPSRLYVALDKGRVVAVRGFFASRWEAGSPLRTFDLLSAGMLVIDPAHRGRGVFTELMAGAFADIAGECSYVISLSAGSATRLGSLTMGWREAGRVRVLANSNRAAHAAPWQRAAATALGRVAPDIASPFLRIDRRLRGGHAELAAGIVLSSEPRPAAMADLTRRRPPDGRFRQVRGEGYFAWRFTQPLARYRFLYKLSGQGDRLDGFLVLQTKARVPGWPVSLVQCEPPGGPHASALLAAALGSGVLGRVRAWTEGFADDARGVLTRFGFREIPIRSFAEPYQTLLVRPAEPALPPRPWLLADRDVLDLRNWELCQLDSDVL